LNTTMRTNRNILLAVFAVVLLVTAQAGEIHDAVLLGNVVHIGQLLEKNPQLVNARNDKGQTPLHLAVEEGSKKVVALLLAFWSRR